MVYTTSTSVKDIGSAYLLTFLVFVSHSEFLLVSVEKPPKTAFSPTNPFKLVTLYGTQTMFGKP